MNHVYQVQHQQSGHIVTTCITRELADYLATSKNATMRTAGRADRFQVVPVDFGFEFK